MLWTCSPGGLRSPNLPDVIYFPTLYFQERRDDALQITPSSVSSTFSDPCSCCAGQGGSVCPLQPSRSPFEANAMPGHSVPSTVHPEPIFLVIHALQKKMCTMDFVITGTILPVPFVLILLSYHYSSPSSFSALV